MDMDHDACYRAIQTRDARFDGRLFIGVHTTGIYCRPICPAQTPKKQNVAFYAAAAAAQEAGFRPCLRCRPEASPDFAIWRGTANTVARAAQLIEAGALDDGDVEALAARLGVGERQLRRLFQQHVGASPIAVAQTRRVLLAKQLIHQTNLPMTDIAMASGFGSVRRFNETFQALFKRPARQTARRTPFRRVGSARQRNCNQAPLPRPLRLGHDPGVPIGTRHPECRVGHRRRLRPHHRLRRRTWDHPRHARRRRHARRHRRLPPRTISTRDHRPDTPRVRLGGGPLGHRHAPARRSKACAACRRTTRLRVPGAWDGFELAVRAILGQQITVGAATRLAGILANTFGEKLANPQSPNLTRIFPSAETIAKADLSVLGMPRARIKSLSALAAAVAADPQIFGARRGLDEAITQLRGLSGIGEWTAQYIAMRELREPDAFPASDIGLLRAMEGKDGKRPTPAWLLARAEKWRPWRAYAALHLWASDMQLAKPPRPKFPDTDRPAANLSPASS